MGQPSIAKDERKARRLFNRGWRRNAKGAHADALPYLREALALRKRALELVEASPDAQQEEMRVRRHKEIAQTLTELAFTCFQLVLPDEVIDYSQQSIEHFREIADGAGESGALNDLGKVYENMLKTSEAIEHYQEALTLAQEVGAHDAELTARRSLFRLYTELKAFDEAKKYL